MTSSPPPAPPARSSLASQSPEPSSAAIVALDEAGASDASALLEEVAQWANARSPGFWSSDAISVERLTEKSQLGQLFGQFERGELVACMLIEPDDPIQWPDAEVGQALYLHKLAVRRSAAGHRIGEGMIAFAEHYCRLQGVSALRLDTIPDGPLPDFYLRLGFDPDPAGPAYFAGRRLIRMQKPLGSRPTPWGA